MTTKRKPATKQDKGPIRLNLNLRTRTSSKNAPWKHYPGLSFICEADTQEQAATFARRLRAHAMALALEMRLAIPGAIYIPREEANGITESQAPANPSAARA